MEIQKHWRRPEAIYRSFPFWAWNGKLDQEELVRQVRQMKEAGTGGFFIHSREGLETEYMGPEWMECVKAVVQEAKRLGMYAWLYDEDRFPSGTAGGEVTACGDEFRCKGLTMEVAEPQQYKEIYQKEIQGRKEFRDDQNGILAVFRAEIEGERMLSFQRLAMKEEEVLGEKEVLLVIRLEVSARSEWFNHQAPPDNLNPRCVKKFIELTHEKYKAAVGEEFGKTIPGIFTDEPSLHDRHAYFGENKAWIPWTYGMGDYYREQNGYDFLDVIPWMYFQGEGAKKARGDYWRTIARRYGEAYFKTISQWCSQNNLLFTGHFLQEDKMGLAVRVNGAVMPNYQYQHVPGIDMLCEQTGEYMTVKQCTSVASQLGKKMVISEMYGCTGWDFTFEGQKWMGDWQFVLGVNRRCQHLALYSLRGCRKRDYPPSFNYNTNWWNCNQWMEDYFARLSMVLEQGEAVRDILLLHPVSTVWSRLGVSPWGNPVRRKERDVPELNQYGERFNQLIQELVREHLDLDLGDELLIEQYGSVNQGKFCIGAMNYSAVVIPPDMDSMLESTRSLLLAFLKQGGMILEMKSSSGERSFPFRDSLICQGQEGQVVTAEDIRETVKSLRKFQRVFLQNGEGEECRDVLYQLRKLPEGYLLFLVNNNRDKAAEGELFFSSAAVPEELDVLEGGEFKVPPYQNSADGLRMQVHLGKTGSALYRLKPCRADLHAPAGDAPAIPQKSGGALGIPECMPPIQRQTFRVNRTVLSGPFPYRLDHPNVLPLDMCRFRLDGGEWSEEMEVWQAQKLVREKLGMRQINHNGIEQRYRWVRKPHPQDGHRLEMTFAFWSEMEIAEVKAAVECLEEFALQVNGSPLRSENSAAGSTSWFLDRSFQTTDSFGICRGENQIMLSCDYRNHMELENIYLLGGFCVNPDRSLGKLPDRFPCGDWTKAGLKHYCGSVSMIMEYCWTGENPQVYLTLPPAEGVCLKLRINQEEKILFTDFHRDFPIGQYLNPGRNQIEVEVVGSPRNMMGPFHLKQKPYNTHDASFCPEPEEYSSAYLLTPYGMMGEVEIREVEEGE